MRSIQRTIGLLAAVCLLMPAFALWAQTAEGDLAGACQEASKLYDQGAYAQARDVLAKALKAAPADADTAQARTLTSRVDNALEDLYQRQINAREQAVARAEKQAGEAELAAKRQADMLAEASRLFEEGEATGQAAKYEEAARLRGKVAKEVASNAYDRAMAFYEQGEFEKARIVFTNLQKWVEEQNTLDESVRLSLGARPTANIARYLGQIDQAKSNSEAGMEVFQARARARIEQAEGEKLQRNALRNFNEAVLAFDKGDIAKAKRLFKAVEQSQADIGTSRQKEMVSYLAQIGEIEKDIAARRTQALSDMGRGENMLNRGDWKGAVEFLNLTLQQEDVLLSEERQKLAGLMQEADEAALQASTLEGLPAGMTEAESAAAAEYLTRARDLLKVLEEQNQKLADERVLLAKEEYRSLNYEKALKHVEAALRVVPDHPEALKLRADLRALLKLDDGAVPPLALGSAVKVRMDQVRGEMNRAIDRGRMYKEAGKYDMALEQFSLAGEALDYLRPNYDVRNTEGLLNGLIAETQKGKADAEAALQQQKAVEAIEAAESGLADRRMTEERMVLGLMELANDEFTRGKYEAAIEAAERVLEREPSSMAAKDIIEQSEQALRRRSWSAIYEADKRNRENENVRLRARLIWPGGTIEYPAKAVWKMICDRERVDEMSAEDRPMSDQEKLHYAALDERIEAFSFEETPLYEVINFFKLLPQFENINFVVDDAALGDTEIFITRTMNNVTLRQALTAMLTPRSLQFIIANDSIFISNADGIRRIEASDVNLYFHQYDVTDLLISLEGGSSNSDSNSSDSNSSSNSNSSSSNSDNGSSGGTSDASDELLDLIRLFTGGDTQWDVIGSMGGSDSEGNNGDDGGSSGSGFGGSSGFGGGSGLGGGSLTEGEEARRIAILRQGYLMVQHVDRIHKVIQELLARLRAQIAIQVDVEGRFITYSDQFYKDFRISWENLDFNLGSKLGFIPHSNVTLAGINPIVHANDFGLNTQMLEMNIQFMNSSQTSAVVKAVKNSKHATEVSAPHVLVVNTQEQEISLDTQGAYVSGYTVEDGFAIPEITTYTVSSTSLTVTPVVSADRRYVTMTVDISIDSTSLVPTEIVIPIRTEGSDNVAGNAGSVTASISTELATSNSIESIVRVPDCGTVVLGGLATVAETKGEGSIPVLCHVPILKRLVTSSAVGKQRIHNIFLVTPTILLNEEVEP